MRWRGQSYALRYGNVKLQLTDGTANSVRWTATVAFTTANIRYPLLGMTGCLEFLDARFLGMNRLLELETNASLDAVVQS